MSSCVGPVGFEAPQGEPFAKRVDGVHTMLPAPSADLRPTPNDAAVPLHAAASSSGGR